MDVETSSASSKNLSVLKLSEEILISKQHELIEAVCFCERRSVFQGELINCKKKCCKAPFFDYRVLDENKQAFLQMSGFGQKEIEVQGPPQTVLGRVAASKRGCTPYYTAYNSSGQVIANIEGPKTFGASKCCCGRRSQFQIFDSGNKRLGRIGRGATGLNREVKGVDFVAVTFPLDMPLQQKAVLIGAGVFILFRHFFPNKKCSCPLWFVNVAL